MSHIDPSIEILSHPSAVIFDMFFLPGLQCLTHAHLLLLSSACFCAMLPDIQSGPTFRLDFQVLRALSVTRCQLPHVHFGENMLLLLEAQTLHDQLAVLDS